jgi:beta-mannosidase
VAHIDAEVEIEAAAAGPANVSVQYSEDGKPVTLARTVTVHAGSNVIDLPVEIQKPKLWYPAGYGEQPLYEFTAQAGTGADSRVSHSESRPAFCRASSGVGQMGPQL